MAFDTLSKIQRGLASRERLRKGFDSSGLTPLLGTPRSLDALLKLLTTAQTKGDRYREFAAGIRATIDKFRTTKEREIADIPSLTKAQRSDIVKAAVAAEREQVLKIGRHDGVSFFEDRERIRAEIVEIRRLMSAVKSEWNSPIAAIMRGTLGSEKRRGYAADVASAGPQELDALLRHAAALGGDEGKALCAAVFQRLDYLAENSPDVRSRCTVGKDDVASILAGHECRAAQQAIEAVEILGDDIGLEAVELSGGDVSQVARDALHMRKHAFNQQFPKEPEPKDKE